MMGFMTNRTRELAAVSLIALALAAVFVSLPGVDLMASGLFYQDGKWLLERDSLWLYPIFEGLPLLGRLVLVTIAVIWVGSQLDRHGKLHSKRPVLTFLLAGILVGPVLVADIGLKDHSGRARPINVQEFGGKKEFSPAFVPANQCIKNCSFVSGHVVGASFIMAFGWLSTAVQRRRWLIGSLAAAVVVGVVRMVPGGHFLSDVTFAWLFVYFSLWLTEVLLRLVHWQKPDGDESLQC